MPTIATPGSEAPGPIRERLHSAAVRLYERTHKKFAARLGLHRWRDRLPRVTDPDWTSEVKLEELIDDRERVAQARNTLLRASEVLIAAIDQDGYFLSALGPLNGLPCVLEAEFLPRKKHRLSLILTEQGLGVRKEFRNDPYGYAKEVEILRVLNDSGCNVPWLVRADPEALAITTSFIQGRVLREELATHGALIRDRDGVCRDIEARRIEGKRVLRNVISGRIIDLLWSELQRLHANGVIWSDIKYGNVLIEQRSNRPFLLDFERSYYFPRKGLAFRALRARDARRFNRFFR